MWLLLIPAAVLFLLHVGSPLGNIERRMPRGTRVGDRITNWNATGVDYEWNGSEWLPVKR